MQACCILTLRRASIFGRVSGWMTRRLWRFIPETWAGNRAWRCYHGWALPQVQFVICGEGAARRDLERACAGVANLQILPLQPEEALRGMLSAADAHRVPQRRGAADQVLPSKLANILAVGGRAVVTADLDTEPGRLVREHPGVAVLARPEDPRSLAAGILEAVRQTRAEGRCNEIARRYAGRHSGREAILRRFEERLSEG